MTSKKQPPRREPALNLREPASAFPCSRYFKTRLTPSARQQSTGSARQKPRLLHEPIADVRHCRTAMRSKAIVSNSHTLRKEKGAIAMNIVQKRLSASLQAPQVSSKAFWKVES
eukprot:5619313-Pleurochrysis_carterae.AAC.1